MAGESLDHERLDFDRAKWAEELRVRDREVAIKEREQVGWFRPTVVAIFAAALAAGANVFVSWYNARNEQALDEARASSTEALERHKAEAARILEAIKTGDADVAAGNIAVMLRLGLIRDPENIEARPGLSNGQEGQT
jgi:hypothetical protein